MSDTTLLPQDLALLRTVATRRDPARVGVVDRIIAGEITEQEQQKLIDALGDEIWEDGMDGDGLTEYGERLRFLIDAVQIVSYSAKPHHPSTAAIPGTDD